MAAFDYRSPTCVEGIRAFTGGKLHFIWNTIDSPSAIEICAAVIAPGGRYGTVAFSADFPRDDVESSFSVGHTAFGGHVRKATFEEEDCSQDAAFARNWVEEAEALLKKGSIKPHPSKIEGGLEGVLEGVLEGLDSLRSSRVSGVKLVYTL